MTDVTQLLDDLADGRPSAANELFPLVYEQLRALAGSFFRDEATDHTLQPTALVHEAYLRMVGPAAAEARTRIHFHALAARVMRHVLVDHARRKGTAKRGGGGGDRARIALSEEQDGLAEPPIDIDELDQVLTRLGILDEQTGRVVELRFFGGLASEEIAEAMGISLSSVEREWRFARAWLSDQLRGTVGG